MAKTSPPQQEYRRKQHDPDATADVRPSAPSHTISLRSIIPRIQLSLK
jgi:hypothetical protein